MIVCILWQHRLAIRHVHPQRGLFFAPEADSVLAITQKKEGWQLQLSDTLQFLDSPRRCRLISRRHDELCYLPFYEKIDLFYTFDETGFNQYTLYQRPQGCWMLNDQRLSELCGDQDEPWAILDFDQNLAKETTQFPGMIVNGVHQRQTRLEAGMRPAVCGSNDPDSSGIHRTQQSGNAAQNQAEAAAPAGFSRLDVPAAG